MTKKPWGEDYVPDDRPWTFPPNAEEVEAKEQAIHQAALALSESGHAADWNDAMIMAEVAVVAAVRALAKPDGHFADAGNMVAKPDEGVVERLKSIIYLAKHRVDDGDEMGANVWRLALTDIEAEANAALSSLSDNAGVR